MERSCADVSRKFGLPPNVAGDARTAAPCAQWLFLLYCSPAAPHPRQKAKGKRGRLGCCGFAFFLFTFAFIT